MRSAAPTSEAPRLSDRQRTALTLVAEGLKVEEIAAELYVSPSAARDCLAAVRDKLETRNSAGAVAKAFRLGLLK